MTELESDIQSGKTKEHRLWSGTQIKRWVPEKTGRQIHKTTAWRMFAKLNLTQQTPRPEHRARASAKEQAESDTPARGGGLMNSAVSKTADYRCLNAFS